MMSAGKYVALPVLAALMLLADAVAQDFPAKPIHIVVPSAAGGTFDLSARLIGQGMNKILGQSVVVENRPGAATMIGAELVATAPKDGHTLLFAAASTLVTAPHLYRNIRYKLADFEPIALVSKVPVAVVVSPAVPAKTIREFVDWAKPRPLQANYATTGRGSFPHVTSELLARELGIRMVDIAYPGAAQATTDLLGGRIHLYTDAITTAIPNHKSGKAIIIGLLSEARSPILPDVPTFVEAGYPKAVAYTWFGMLAPAGTPRGVIAKLNDVIGKALESSDIRGRFESDGQIIDSRTPEGFRSFIDSEYQKFGELIRSSGITIQ